LCEWPAAFAHANPVARTDCIAVQLVALAHTERAPIVRVTTTLHPISGSVTHEPSGTSKGGAEVPADPR
jgi:hypothetical protein